MRRSTIRSPDGARIVAALVAAASAAIIATCSSHPRPTPPSKAPAVAGAAAPARSAAASSRPRAGTAAPSGSAASVPRAPVQRSFRLLGFFRALRGLETGARAGHVRILWFGDSHTQADFWTDAVRKALQKRFGNGGPGFVHVGLGSYRHSSFEIHREGAWHREPRAPSSVARHGDGVYGLGGMRAVPGAGASASLKLRRGAAPGRVRWDVAYRPIGGTPRLEVSIGGQPPEPIDGARDAGTTILHFESRDSSETSLSLHVVSGSLQLFGVLAESDGPGVVLDTLGINGARIRTPLAWDEETWIAEIRRRAPSLIVLAYGTNDIGDAIAVEKYPRWFEELMRRAKRAAAGVDCLLVGPTDLALPDWTSHPRASEMDGMEREAARELGCDYFSVYEAMGGDGGIHRWFETSPPLAHGDHVHLTPRGYAKLGREIARRLLSAYDRWKERSGG